MAQNLVHKLSFKMILTSSAHMHNQNATSDRHRIKLGGQGISRKPYSHSQQSNTFTDRFGTHSNLWKYIYIYIYIYIYAILI